DCSTPRRLFQPSDWRAGNGTRTRDPNLGKVVLYQLSYSRMPAANVTTQSGLIYRPGSHGGEGDRTPDLVNAIHALSQLSYAPAIFPRPKNRPAGTRHLIGTLRRCQAISRSFHEHFRCRCVLKSSQIRRTNASYS